MSYRGMFYENNQEKVLRFYFFCIFAPSKKIGLWCNGNTTDSGPVFPGSNPGIPTDKPLVKDKDLLKL